MVRPFQNGTCRRRWVIPSARLCFCLTHMMLIAFCWYGDCVRLREPGLRICPTVRHCNRTTLWLAENDKRCCVQACRSRMQSFDHCWLLSCDLTAEIITWLRPPPGLLHQRLLGLWFANLIPWCDWSCCPTACSLAAISVSIRLNDSSSSRGHASVGWTSIIQPLWWCLFARGHGEEGWSHHSTATGPKRGQALVWWCR